MPLYNKIRNLKRQLENVKQENSKLVHVKKLKTTDSEDNSKHLQPSISEKQMEQPPSSGHIVLSTSESPVSVDSVVYPESVEPVADQSGADQSGADQSGAQCLGSITISTPEKTAVELMRQDNLSPTSAPMTLKELVALNTLANQVAAAPKATKKAILTKKPNKLYPRCKSLIARKLGINRHYVLSPTRQKTSQKRKLYLQKKKQVVNFLKRNENSIVLPTKKDVSPHGLQKYALNDTVKNLYHKFLLEYPDVRMCFSTFAKQRPKYIKSIKWAERRQCLCVKHQNVALKLKAIKISQSPNLFIKENSHEEILKKVEQLADKQVKYQVWRLDEIACKEEKIIKKVRLQEDVVAKAEFIEIVDDEFSVFREHVRRTTEQYAQIKKLRETLDPNTEVTVQMDYSENFGCMFQDEPAQVFYDRQLITLHPMVIHYKTADGKIAHQSFVGVTDVTKHSFGTTLAFIYKLMPHIKIIKPEVKIVHYVSDSPASQYRNKFSVKFLAEHTKLFPGINATWEFLEAGHGKGPCDGIGGSVKKLAEIAIKKGHIIKCASDFCNWFQTEPTCMKMFLITPGDVKCAELKIKSAPYVKGISSVHSIRPFGTKIYFRETSCFEACCRNSVSDHEWQETNVNVVTSETVSERVVRANVHENVNEESVLKYKVSDFVQVVFRRKQYVGQIVKIDVQLKEYYINFMTRRKNGKYVFPKIKEELWMRAHEIVGLFVDKN